jgi:hypothetical protein
MWKLARRIEGAYGGSNVALSAKSTNAYGNGGLRRSLAPSLPSAEHRGILLGARPGTLEVAAFLEAATIETSCPRASIQRSRRCFEHDVGFHLRNRR